MCNSSTGVQSTSDLGLLSSEQTSSSNQLDIINLLPPFDIDNPFSWAQTCIEILKYNFKRKDIYKTLLVRLPPKIQYLTLEGEPESDQDYLSRLLDILRTHFEPSDRAKIEQLLKKRTLGDRKPSTLLSEMRGIVKSHQGLDEEALFPIVKELFVRSLPPLYTKNVDLHYCTSYKALGDLAERIYNTSTPSSSCYSDVNNAHTISNTNPASCSQTHIPTTDLSYILARCDRLEAKLEKYEKMYDKRFQKLWNAFNNLKVSLSPVTSSEGSRRGGKCRSKNRPRQRYNSSRSGDNNSLCFYHNKFGNDAYVCEEFCLMFPSFQNSVGQITSN